MRQHIFINPIHLIYLTVFSGCDLLETPSDDYQSAIVIEANLIANKPFEGLTLLETVSLKEDLEYQIFGGLTSYPIEKRVVGASVSIISEDTVYVLNDKQMPGIYKTDSIEPFIPKPGKQYELQITNDSLNIKSITTVPDQVQIVNPVAGVDTLIHGVGDFFFDIRAENALGFFVFVNRKSQLENINYRIINDYNPNNTWFLSLDTHMSVPWNYFSSLKTNIKIWVWAVDVNLYDFYAEGVSYKLETKTPLYHFESNYNIMGYFGSVTIDSFYVYLEPGVGSNYICTDNIGREIACP